MRLGALVGGGSINVRGGADKDSARIAQWPAGTQVTVYGVDGNWCEVEFDGQHGWVASKYVVAYQSHPRAVKIGLTARFVLYRKAFAA